jgi:hypothetical protein
MGGMPLALITTGSAGRRAGFDHCPEDAEIRRGLTYHDTGGSVASVGAVEAEPNTAHQLVHVVLREIGVGTTCAAGATVEALFDTAQERVVINPCRLWMCLDYVLKGHVLSPLSVGPSTRSGNSLVRYGNWVSLVAEVRKLPPSVRVRIGQASP